MGTLKEVNEKDALCVDDFVHVDQRFDFTMPMTVRTVVFDGETPHTSPTIKAVMLRGRMEIALERNHTTRDRIDERVKTLIAFRRHKLRKLTGSDTHAKCEWCQKKCAFDEREKEILCDCLQEIDQRTGKMKHPHMMKLREEFEQAIEAFDEEVRELGLYIESIKATDCAMSSNEDTTVIDVAEDTLQ